MAQHDMDSADLQAAAAEPDDILTDEQWDFLRDDWEEYENRTV